MVNPLQKEDIKLEDWEFEFQQRGEQPISLCDFFCRSLDQYFFSQIGAPAQHSNYLFTDTDKGYNSRAHKEAVAKVLKESVADRTFARQIIKNSIDIPRSFNAVADALAVEINDEKISNAKLAAYWKDMDESILKLIPWFYYPWYISKENFLTDKVKDGLEKQRAKVETVCDFDDALLAVVFPVKKTGFQLEQEEMLGLVNIAEKNTDFANDAAFKEKAAEYLKKYDWLTTFIFSPLLPMTYEQLVERVKRAVKEGFKDNLALQKETLKKNESIAQKVIDAISGDNNLVEDIADARELGYVLTAGIEEAYMSSARYLPFMQVVANRIGVAFEDMKYLMSYEIISALEAEQTILTQTIEERRNGFVMMIKDGIQYASFGEAGHQISVWVDTELNKVDANIQELRGQPACKGFATGKVRIALQPSQAHLLEEGEILVCPMTNPDYVPAMRRSAAIVTDEGGLLSHAAIMSREFGKPCVIATKIATQTLKTGDVIEVDANKGIVKVLSRV